MNGAGDRQADGCRFCSNADTVPVCCGKERAEPKDEAASLLVSLCSSPLAKSHELSPRGVWAQP